MFKATTQGITVTVMPVYIDERSDPAQSQYFWAYRVTLENGSDAAVKLISRHWKIMDGEGHQEEVHGEGVVGEQPVIAPGESFAYTSGCPLNSPSGIMKGSYTMQSSKGDLFDIEIPAFPLDLPGLDPVIN